MLGRKSEISEISRFPGPLIGVVDEGGRRFGGFEVLELIENPKEIVFHFSILALGRFIAVGLWCN